MRFLSTFSLFIPAVTSMTIAIMEGIALSSVARSPRAKAANAVVESASQDNTHAIDMV
jgi:hypothetical protein